MQLEDGTPVTGASVSTEFSDPVLSIPGGFFSFEADVPAEGVLVRASAQVEGRRLSGSSGVVPVVRDGITDAGIITLGMATVFVNNNVFTNSVSAFTVLDDGLLAAVSGSPFPTGGSGSQITLLDSATVCQIRNHLFVTNSRSNNVTSFTVEGDGTLTPVPGSPFPTGGSSPVPLVDTPDGKFLYVGNFSSNTISMFSINNDGSLTALSSPVSTARGGPIGLTANRAGTLLFVSFNSSPRVIQVFRISQSGDLSEVGVFQAGTSSAVGMSINSAGTRLFAPDFGSGRILVYDVSETGQLAQIPGSPFPNPGVFSPVDSQISRDDRFLYVVNRSGHVSVFTIDGNGALSPVPGSPFATGGTTPEVLALSSTRPFLYVVNANSRTVTTFQVGSDGTLIMVGSPVPTGAGGFPTGIAISE